MAEKNFLTLVPPGPAPAGGGIEAALIELENALDDVNEAMGFLLALDGPEAAAFYLKHSGVKNG